MQFPALDQVTKVVSFPTLDMPEQSLGTQPARLLGMASRDSLTR